MFEEHEQSRDKTNCSKSKRHLQIHTAAYTEVMQCPYE